MKTKLPEANWEQFESIPFAVVFYSSQVGWITMTQPGSVEAAHRSFEACDSKQKMLLNYGMIVREVKP